MARSASGRGRHQTLIALPLCLAVSACGGGSDSSSTGSSTGDDGGEDAGNGSGTTTGATDINGELDATRAFGRVSLFETPDMTPDQRFISAMAWFASAETVAASLPVQDDSLDTGCRTGTAGSLDDNPLDDTDERISAGSPLTVTGPEGFALSLTTIENSAGQPVYQSSVMQASNATLDALQLDIPGDTFPAFEAVPVPANAVLTGFVPPLSSLVEPDTVFEWDASVPSDLVQITVRFEGGGGATDVVCRVADTGQFMLPDDIQSELQGAAAPGWDIRREAVADVMTDTAVLQVVRVTNP